MIKDKDVKIEIKGFFFHDIIFIINEFDNEKSYKINRSRFDTYC